MRLLQAALLDRSNSRAPDYERSIDCPWNACDRKNFWWSLLMRYREPHHHVSRSRWIINWIVCIKQIIFCAKCRLLITIKFNEFDFQIFVKANRAIFNICTRCMSIFQKHSDILRAVSQNEICVAILCHF